LQAKAGLKNSKIVVTFTTSSCSRRVCTPEQVFNADETGLFWKRMPSRTFLSKNEKTAPGFKAAKHRLTLLLCADACGFMMKSMVVYESLNPRAFKGK